MKITAVTGLYDIGRSSVDGRTMDMYVEWLNKTLQLPLPFLIFLDPEFDAQNLAIKPEDRIIRVAKNELGMFKHRAAVEKIISDGITGNKRDISFSLADYGMMVMSKPSLIKRAADETDADFLLWIDAGHCRFIEDVSLENLHPPVEILEGTCVGLNVTPFLRQRMRIGRFPRSMVGKCLAMSSAEDFIVSRSFAKEFSDRLDFLVETDWLPNGRWDNEQTAMGCLLFRGGLPGARILNTVVRGGGNTARLLFEHPPQNSPYTPDVLWRLFLDEFRTRSVPKLECYLPNDFPEQQFQEFAAARSS